jgi:hypothetical protein
MSDATPVTNFSGGQQVWPIYMTIGNITSDMRRKNREISSMVVANIPVPPKLDKATEAEKQAFRDRKNQLLQHVISSLIDCISGESNVNFTAICADQKVRRCFPKVVGWIGDYPEQIK